MIKNKGGPIEAVIQKVVNDGNHGPYAVATCEGLKGSITFSLEKPVWNEKDRPNRGDIVILDDIRKKRAGWRAQKARFLRPSDEK